MKGNPINESSARVVVMIMVLFSEKVKLPFVLIFNSES